jgi:hypothetical protein
MRYDAEEFIARSRSPPEAPQPTREKIGITRKRLMLAVIVGLLPVLVMWKMIPILISPPPVQTAVPQPTVSKPDLKLKQVQRPAPKRKKVEAVKKQPTPTKLFW